MGTRMKYTRGLLVAAILCPSHGQSQQGAPSGVAPTEYDVHREINLTGTVRAYTPAPQAPPFGAHVTLQTAAGAIDVHLGSPKLLAANHFTIEPGDTLRIVGESVAYGTATQFVARIVQKGTQVLMVRSVRGIPLSFAAPRNAAGSKPQGGAL